MAAEKGACIGAHVSFVDKENFGRTQLDTSPAELREQVLWQASALDGLCRGAGTRYLPSTVHTSQHNGRRKVESDGETSREMQLLSMDRETKGDTK